MESDTYGHVAPGKSAKIENECRQAEPGSKFAIGPPPRKRGGQPGNQNARKSGRYDKEKMELRARIRDSIRRANAAVAWVDEHYGPKPKRGRPRKDP